MNLKGVLSFCEEIRQQKTHHIILFLKGKFRVGTVDISHLLPITDATSTKTPVCPWFSKGLDRRVKMEKKYPG